MNEGRRGTRQPRTVAGAQRGSRLVVVPVLILLNLAVFAYTVAQANSLGRNTNSQMFQDWQLWPPIVAGGEWWRLFTAGFLHSGPIHIALNMMALYLLGRELEPLLGRLRFAAIYLISLLGGSVAVYLLGDERVPVVGASTAVWGLMGAILVVVLRLKMNPRPVLMIVALNVFISIAVPNISLLGHLGGGVIGALATAAIVYAPAKSRTLWQASTFVLLAIALVGLVLVRDAQFGELACVRQPVLECTQNGG